MGNGGVTTAEAFREAMADIHIASELTQRMLEIVARDMRHWADLDIPVDHIGVNVSLADFHGGGLDQQIAGAHTLHGLPLEHLVIELTEGAYSALRDGSIIGAVEALRARGLRIALDDFGTGGGMLMPLLTMPVDIIKIDKILIDRLAPQGAGSAVIGGLLHAAKELNVTVVAEGVENEAQAIQLAWLGCKLGQGYFFSKPIDRQAATTLLSSNLAAKIVGIS